MRKRKSVTLSICESRKIAMPDEINPHGTLFGGVIMSWIDKIGYMCAQNYAESKKTVTVNIDNIQFLKPVYSGEHVALRALVSSVGQSSMEIDVTLHKEDPVSKKRELVGEAFLTFVSLGDNGKGKMVPELCLENTDDRVRNKKAQLRSTYRKELRKTLETAEDEFLEIIEEVENVNAAPRYGLQMIKDRVLIRNYIKLTYSKHFKLDSSGNFPVWKFFRVINSKIT